MRLGVSVSVYWLGKRSLGKRKDQSPASTRGGTKGMKAVDESTHARTERDPSSPSARKSPMRRRSAPSTSGEEVNEPHDLSWEVLPSLRRDRSHEIGIVRRRVDYTINVGKDEVLGEVPRVHNELGDGRVRVSRVGTDEPRSAATEGKRRSKKVRERIQRAYFEKMIDEERGRRERSERRTTGASTRKGWERGAEN